MSTSPRPNSAAFTEAIARAALGLLPSHARAIAAAAEQHAAPGTSAARAMADAVPHDGVRPIARRLAETWAEAFDPATARPDGGALGLALRVAVDAGIQSRGEQLVDIVWTGPSTNDVQPRVTPAVIEELAEESQHVLWVVSFAAYKVPAVVESLRRAADRGVSVRLVLETKDDSQGALSFDASSAFASIRDKVAIYVWPHDRRPMAGGGHAAMHAKAVIADGSAAFVTSANLTGTALTENMELGLLVRGGGSPRRLATHFQSLVEAGTLRRLPT